MTRFSFFTKALFSLLHGPLITLLISDVLLDVSAVRLVTPTFRSLCLYLGWQRFADFSVRLTPQPGWPPGVTLGSQVVAVIYKPRFKKQDSDIWRHMQMSPKSRRIMSYSIWVF